MDDDIVSRLKKREVRRLPTNWQKGRLCPNCGSPADRPRCLWDLGGQCPRDEPSEYEEDVYEYVPDPDCAEAAREIKSLRAKVKRLERLAGKEQP